LQFYDELKEVQTNQKRKKEKKGIESIPGQSTSEGHGSQRGQHAYSVALVR
jgi:hypothetical protein